MITATQKPAITINTTSSIICTGSPVSFTATAENAGSAPGYQWLLNGNDVGSNQPAYTNSTLADGDRINCVLSANTGCGHAFSSDTITMIVTLPPVITMGADKQIFQGSNVKLAPLVSGDVAGYQWTPTTGLDNAAIANPVARPSETTKYTLTVTAAGGCTATGSITVKVLTDLIVPNAFSPNGDGINDTWNINSLSIDYPNCAVDVFNRYGQPVFHSEGYAKAWDGTYHKAPLPVGVYYYIIDLKNGSGKMSGSLTIVR
jgi:gliding motility-associated-like protein